MDDAFKMRPLQFVQNELMALFGVRFMLIIIQLQLHTHIETATTTILRAKIINMIIVITVR